MPLASEVCIQVFFLVNLLNPDYKTNALFFNKVFSNNNINWPDNLMVAQHVKQS